MVRRVVLTVVLLGGCVWCVTLVARAGNGRAASAETTARSAASLRSLMNGQARHLEAIGALLDDPSAEDRAKRLVIEAELLAELARASDPHLEESDHHNRAAEHRAATRELAAEARRTDPSDPDRITALREKVAASCTGCHAESR